MDNGVFEAIDRFNHTRAQVFFREHFEIPLTAVVLYLTMICFAPSYIARRWPGGFSAQTERAIGVAVGISNFTLSIFSAICAVVLGRYIISSIAVHFYEYSSYFINSNSTKYSNNNNNRKTTTTTTSSVDDGDYHDYSLLRFIACADPSGGAYLDGATGLCIMLYCSSKIIQLIDTVFLILQRRELIFLQYFHHSTMVLFTWYAYAVALGFGKTLAVINFVVHFCMYSYFFIVATLLAGPAWESQRRAFRCVAGPFVTFIQTAQMFFGMFMCIVQRCYFYQNKCAGGGYDEVGNAVLTFLFASYGVLEVMLFHKLHCADSAVTHQCVEKKVSAGQQRSKASSSSPSPSRENSPAIVSKKVKKPRATKKVTGK